MAGKIRIVLDAKGGGNPGLLFKRGSKKFAEKSIKAIQRAARRLTLEMESKGRDHIAKQGNFTSARWQLGLRALMSYRSRTDIRIRVTHQVRYWRVFEFAPTIIKAKNPTGLLWIPLSFANIPKGMMARDYPEPMFRVDRSNGKAPLLISDTGPKYFGIPQVKIKTKWRLRALMKRQFKRLPTFYKQEMKKKG